ncbi:MAG: AMP-binding protein [Nostoc sp.]|uniref:AMP-binding protein n=1 Tax=Nostoc sp. TaxID=1180 RepID=UPI002FF61379
MQLDNYNQLLENSSNLSFKYREIEVAIRASFTVNDCIFRERETENLKQELVAYVVLSGLFVAAELLSHLQAILPIESTPRAIVPVSTLPFTDRGELDEVTLATLEVIDSDLMLRIEDQLESLLEIERVAVVCEPIVKSIPPLHLEDLLPDTQAMSRTGCTYARDDSQQNLQATTFSIQTQNNNSFLPKKLAISHGKPLQNPQDASKTLAEVLQRTAQSTKSIVYIQPDGIEKVINVSTDLILQNPLKWLDLIDLHKATISWAPNFAFSLICDRAFDINRNNWDLSSMRFLINAGEPIVTKVARKFLKLLSPHGLRTNAIHPAFGMCETASGITFSDSFSLKSSSDETSFVELGYPIAGTSLRIVDENEQIVTENTIGRLQVKGASVTSGYYQNLKANKEVFTSDGWFNTGDLGFLHQGRLTITGRQKDVIIINGLNSYCHEIEATIEEIAGVEVSYTAACAIRATGSNTDQLAIFFSPKLFDDQSLVSLIKEIRTRIVNNLRVNPDYLIPVDKEIIHKTVIGKIQRSQLSQRFNAGEFKAIIKRIDILLSNANTIPD